MVRFATTYTASERRHARSAINTIRSVVMERLYATRHLGEMLLAASHHASCPAGAGRGFRSLTAFAAEWWGPPEGTGGGRWAAMEKAPATALPNPPPISPFFSPLAAHHSAKRDSVERNLRAMCDLQRAIMVNYQRRQTVFCLNPSHNTCFIPSHRCKACVL